jgi:WhiB family transcriptional regulator, redox-sensing transcriptional regulator
MTEEERKRPTWKKQAACRGMNPDYFFPVNGEMTPEARVACRGCPVREECLEFGLSEPVGIWGGRTLRQRERLLRARKRGQGGQAA